MKARILIVDDEHVQRELLAGYLVKRGYEAVMAASGAEALDIVAATTVDVMLTDQKMPGMSGLELASAVREAAPTVSTVVITAFGTVEDAVQAMKNGVEDYLTKPVNLEELDLKLDRIIDRRHLVRENERLREQLPAAPRMPGIIYASVAMQEVMSRASRAAESTATVLITGESGTGKELVARTIHLAGPRRDEPFVAINCAAVPENLIESELFGHEKGSFTGADRRRIGRFEQADGGTLFLDEVGEMPLYVQVKLLRVLQERTFERVGGSESVAVNVRLVAATNRDLEQEIGRGTFRTDLFFRLNVVGIAIPPLRERRQDIPPLVEHFIGHYAAEHHKNARAMSAEALDALVKYPFPGNIRELGNIIEQAVVMSRGDVIALADFPSGIRGHDDAGGDGGLESQVEMLERQALAAAMTGADKNKSAAARILGISERKMRYMLKKYGYS